SSLGEDPISDPPSRVEAEEAPAREEDPPAAPERRVEGERSGVVRRAGPSADVDDGRGGPVEEDDGYPRPSPPGGRVADPDPADADGTSRRRVPRRGTRHARRLGLWGNSLPRGDGPSPGEVGDRPSSGYVPDRPRDPPRAAPPPRRLPRAR